MVSTGRCTKRPRAASLSVTSVSGKAVECHGDSAAPKGAVRKAMVGQGMKWLRTSPRKTVAGSRSGTIHEAGG